MSQDEVAGHRGVAALNPCRTCLVSNNHAEFRAHDYKAEEFRKRQSVLQQAYTLAASSDNPEPVLQRFGLKAVKVLQLMHF